MWSYQDGHGPSAWCRSVLGCSFFQKSLHWRRRPRVSNSGCGAAGAVKSSDSMPRGVGVFVFVCARDGLLWCATHIVGMELNRNYDPTHDSIGKIQKQESSSAFKDPFAFAPFTSAVWWTTRWRNDTFIDSLARRKLLCCSLFCQAHNSTVWPQVIRRTKGYWSSNQTNVQ